MVEGGAREQVGDDCPAGLVALVLQCWANDPRKRCDSTHALTLSRHPLLLQTFECTSWSAVVDAIESDFWRVTQLRQLISSSLDTLSVAMVTGAEVDGGGGCKEAFALGPTDRGITSLLQAFCTLDAGSTDALTYMEAIHFYVVHSVEENYTSEFADQTNAEVVASALRLDPTSVKINVLAAEVAGDSP
jgi:hypothetical protein